MSPPSLYENNDGITSFAQVMVDERQWFGGTLVRLRCIVGTTLNVANWRRPDLVVVMGAVTCFTTTVYTASP